MKILKWVKVEYTLLIFDGNKKRAVRFADHKTTLYNFLPMTNLQKSKDCCIFLEGIYNLKGNQLTKQQEQNSSKPLKLLIRERINPKGKKSKYFLLANGGSNGVYISSLYYLGKKTFHFEYKGVWYLMKAIEQNKAIITLKNA